MKTERRHELANNDLADWLGDKIEALRPYSAAVWSVVLAASVLVFAVVFWTQRRQAASASGWEAYFAALENQNPAESSDKLEVVAIDYARSPAGLWSRLSLADTQLATGVDNLFKDRPAARKALEQAVDDYRGVLEQAPGDSLLAERATLGLAQAYESKENLDSAREQYQALLKRWPDGAFSSLAKERLADLDRKSTKEFYDWFAKQSPQPKPEKPASTLGDKPPFDLNAMPDDFFHSGMNIGGKNVLGEVKPQPDASSDAKSSEAKNTDSKNTDAESPDSALPADTAGKPGETDLP